MKFGIEAVETEKYQELERLYYRSVADDFPLFFIHDVEFLCEAVAMAHHIDALRFCSPRVSDTPSVSMADVERKSKISCI